MKINDYITECEGIFYKHETSENLQCNTYSTHTHNMYELIYFVRGNASHIIEDRKYKLKKGDLILIRPFHYHFIQIDAPDDYERYDILFDPVRHNIESTELIPADTEVINLIGNTAAEDIFKKLDLYNANASPEIFAKLIPTLLSELFYNISLFPQTKSDEISSASPLISEALRYINENLCTISGIGEIAKHLFVSESYLFRIFKNELHESPKKYIMDKRLLLAQKMIASGERPIHVCETCGFGDYTSFYRNYTAFFGHSPSNDSRKVLPNALKSASP